MLSVPEPDQQAHSAVHGFEIAKFRAEMKMCYAANITT